ncbi:unnamed protein product [Trichobilharzia szidati]|nr:unnamed protein product [Trichobilharzia szidati]
MLENLFQKFGHVTSVKLLETSTGFTGIGFVRFATAEQAEKAVGQMNEVKHIVRGGDKPITCKLADKADHKRRNAASNPQALVAADAAAGLHPQIPVGSHINRTTHGLPGLASLQALGQAQQPSFNPQLPLTAQLVQPLQQTPVVVPNLHSSGVSSQNRNVLLSSALLQNGPSGNASFPNGGNCHQNVSTTSYRANLVGIPSALPANQTATVVAGYNDSPFNRSKSCINVQSGSHSANNPPIYTANGNTSQSAHGTFQSLTTYGSPTTSSYQGGLSYVHHQQSQQIPTVPTVANSSQMVVVTPTPPPPPAPISSGGLYQSVSSSSSSSLAGAAVAAAASNGGSVSANYPASSSSSSGSSGVSSHQKLILSSNIPSAACQVQNLQCSMPETTNLNTAVSLMTSEFQVMSFNSTVDNTSPPPPPTSSTCQSNLITTDNVVSSCNTQDWSNGEGQKLCSMNSINSSESDIMPCQQATVIENNSHDDDDDLVVATSGSGNDYTATTENTVNSNVVTEELTTDAHCSNFEQETIPSSSDFGCCLSSLPSEVPLSSLDPSSANHSSASSSTICQTGNRLSSPNLEMNGSSRGGGGGSSSSAECQSEDKLLRKSKLADKKRDSSSNSTACSRRCSEVGLNETPPPTSTATTTTTIPLNRRKKTPHSASSVGNNSKQPQQQQQHSKSPPKKDTTVSGSSEVRLPTSCTLLNPSSP